MSIKADEHVNDWDDGPFAGGQQGRFVFVDPGELLGVGQRANHDRKRFGLSGFARAQPRDRLVVGRVHRQLEATEPSDRDDPAREQELGRRLERVRVRRRLQPECRPAIRAAVGLRMESAIACGAILASAGGALPERAHAGALAIVRHRLDHGEPGPAIGTGDERVVIAPVGGIEQLRLARRAHRDVGRDRLALGGFRQAPEDRERVEMRRRAGFPAYIVDPRQRRCLRPQHAGELIDLFARTLDVDLHVAGRIADPSRQPEPLREPVHERAEPHTLHDAADRDAGGREFPGVIRGRAHAWIRRAMRARRKPYHSARPSLTTDDVMRNCRSGLTARASVTARSTLNGT